MVFVGRLADDTNYLVIINDNQAREIRALHDEIRHYRELNQALLKKLGIIESNKAAVSTGDLHPIGGFTPLRDRIKAAENRSRERLIKLMDEKEKEENATE